MPSTQEIQRYFTGVWRLMSGRPDGVRLLDLSADGFWNSFFALVVALPGLFPTWVIYANRLAEVPGAGSGGLALVLRLALIDGGTWLIPIVLMALAAPTLGIADRFVAYVVASNWATALLALVSLPPVLLELFVPAARDIAQSLMALVFIVTLVLIWRLTNSVLGKGPAVATAVFAAMIAASFAVLFLLDALLGIPPVQSV